MKTRLQGKLPTVRTRVVRGGKAETPQDQSNYNKFYREFTTNERKTNDTIKSDDIVVNIELKLLDIVANLKSSKDKAVHNALLTELKTLRGVIQAIPDKAHKEYLLKQYNSAQTLINSERKSIVGDLLKKSRKTLISATKKTGKIISSAASSVDNVIQDQISGHGVIEDKILGGIYGLGKGVLAAGSSVVAKAASSFVPSKIKNAFKNTNDKNYDDYDDDDYDDYGGNRFTSSRGSFGKAKNPFNSDGVNIVADKVQGQTEILNVHTSLLSKIADISANTSSYIAKSLGIQQKEEANKRSAKFAQEESETETKPIIQSAPVKEGKPGLLKSLVNKGTTGVKDYVVDKISSGAGSIKDVLLGGLLGSKILGKIPGIKSLGSISAKTLSGVKGIAGSGAGFLKKLGPKGLASYLMPLTSIYDSIDATRNNEKHAKEYGTSKGVARSTDLLYAMTGGLGDLIVGDRKATAKGMNIIAGKLSKSYDAVKTLIVGQDKFSDDQKKLHNNVRELRNLKKIIESGKLTPEDVKKQEKRIRDLNEENEKLLNKYLKKQNEEKRKYNYDMSEDPRVNRRKTRRAAAKLYDKINPEGTGPVIGNKKDFINQVSKSTRGSVNNKSFINNTGLSGFDVNNLDSLKKAFPNIEDKDHDSIKKYAKLYNIDPKIIYALIGQESGGKRSAVSPTGVKGLMQVTKATAKGYGLDRDDPEQQIHAGVKHLSVLLNKYNGNLDAALADYNGGHAYGQRALKGRNYTISPDKDRENDGHAKKIMSNLEKMQQESNKKIELAKNTSHQQALSEKFRNQGIEMDMKESKQTMAFYKNISAPQNNIVNNTNNSTIVQSNLRHTENSLAREHDKSSRLI